ncbi:MAG: HRDC domain-containing protein, partial [Burkholderiaceae bacterium]
RAVVAKEHGVPAYVVFHDGTLRAIAAARPSGLDQLADISGVGEKKLERYGTELIGLIRSAE